jgi:flagellar hook-length control protein FliK
MMKGGEKMINQSNLMDFVSKMTPASSANKVQNSQESSSYPKFNDILSSTLKKTSYSTQSSQNYNQSSKAKETDSSDTQQKEQVKAYREMKKALASNIKDSKTEKVNDDKNDENDNKIEDSKVEELEKKVKATTVVNSLAQMLGIKPEEMVKLLNSLNIKTEDMADTSKMEEIVNKLSGVLNLNPQQKQTLSDVIGKIGKTVDDALTQLKQNATDGKEFNQTLKAVVKSEQNDWVKVDNANIKVLVKVEPTLDLSGMAVKLKLKLDELAGQLQQNPQKLTEDISKEITSLFSKADVKTNENNSGTVVKQAEANTEETGNANKTQNSVKATEQPVNEEKSEVVDNVNKVETKGQTKEQTKEDTKDDQKQQGSNSTGLQSADSKADQIILPKTGDTNATQFNPNSVSQPEKADEVIKSVKDISVQKHEIINQVVEKAKVILTPDKSEMVMDLKPDNLGKLSLKVVTERGIVVAKFVAESQQVKEVLESNMQLLKDSLEKQGMSIQGFSVSVGQEQSKGGFNRYSDPQSGEKSDGKKAGALNVKMVNTVNIPERMGKLNPYSRNESSFNLTA